jgi:hypothetical protein
MASNLPDFISSHDELRRWARERRYEGATLRMIAGELSLTVAEVKNLVKGVSRG